MEIYLWWTCNKKCIFCSEYPIMSRNWDRKISESEILSQLLGYKKKWYNHVTYLGGEPFIQSNFLFALKVWKKLWYKILVTTNATTLWIEKQARKYLPYIDELILSINALNESIYKKIHNVNYYLDYEKIFSHIKTYWKWTFLKINIVLNKHNLVDIENILKYVAGKWVSEVSITYPDIYWGKGFYSKEYILENTLLAYKELTPRLWMYMNLWKKLGLVIKFVDVPFCIFPWKEYIPFSDDVCYENRIKLDYKWWELNRNIVLPRRRTTLKKCESCRYYNVCWWPAEKYIELIWDSEIEPYL